MLVTKRLEKGLKDMDLSFVAALVWAVNIEDCRRV
jgi:hypothetical protein